MSDVRRPTSDVRIRENSGREVGHSGCPPLPLLTSLSPSLLGPMREDEKYVNYCKYRRHRRETSKGKGGF